MVEKHRVNIYINITRNIIFIKELFYYNEIFRLLQGFLVCVVKKEKKLRARIEVTQAFENYYVWVMYM